MSGGGSGNSGGGGSEGGGSGGGDGNGGTPNTYNTDQTNYNGASTGSTLPELIIDPVNEEIEENDVDPCIKMNQLKNDSEYKAKLQDLKTKSQQNNFETVFTMKDATNPTTQDNFDYNQTNGNANSNDVAFEMFGGLTKGVIHNHYGNLMSIFTVADLVNIYILVKNTPPTFNFDDMVFTVVTNKQTVYSLSIADRQSFLSFGDKYLENPYDQDQLKKDYIYDYNIKSSNSNSINENGFKKLMEQNNVGLNIFKGDYTSFNSWTKIQYFKPNINCN